MSSPFDPVVAKTGLVSRPMRELLPASTERGQREFNARMHDRFRLKAADGRFLHMSGKGFTKRKHDAWIGFRHQLIAIRLRNPDARGLRVITVKPTVKPHVVWHEMLRRAS